MKLSEDLPQIIRLAEAIQDYWEAELPKRHPNYPFIQEGADDGPPPPELAELGILLETLSEEQLYSLLTLQSIGQSPTRINKVEATFQKMHTYFPTSEQAIKALLLMPMVGQFLRKGQALIEKIGLDVDHFLLTPSMPS